MCTCIYSCTDQLVRGQQSVETEPGLCSEREMRRGDWTPCREIYTIIDSRIRNCKFPCAHTLIMNSPNSGKPLIKNNSYMYHAYRIFLWRGHTLVRPLGVWWDAPPENFLYSTLDPNLILGGGGGGGGGFKLEGGNPGVPPPPSVCNPVYHCILFNAFVPFNKENLQIMKKKLAVPILLLFKDSTV